MSEHESITVACIGAGTVGAGWAAVFLAAGHNVVASDPSPDGEATLLARIDAAWPTLAQLGLAPGASVARLRFERDPLDAAAEADFVQESAPDDKALKIDLLAKLDAVVDPTITIASSSSTFVPTELGSKCRAPGRIIVGHPFVPVYLVPLVEVVGGEHTEQSRIDAACAFYTSLGKRALPLKKEVESYIANRLQYAVFNEAMALVDAGICEWDDIEDAVTQGPGFRWPVVGPVLHRHLGGGRGGVRHMVEHFGWPGVPGREQHFIESVETRWGNDSIEDLEADRDAKLLALYRATR